MQTIAKKGGKKSVNELSIHHHLRTTKDQWTCASSVNNEIKNQEKEGESSKPYVAQTTDT